MTDWLLALVPQYGLWLLLATTFLSCLMLPLPASVVMLMAGGFAAAGDLGLGPVFLAAASGGVAGDQLGYWTGRLFGARLLRGLRTDPGRDRLLARADAMMDRQGLVAVFLTRWLVSPLGPYVNLIAGSARYPWGRFTLAGLAGEAVWAALYIGAGFAFSGDIVAASNAIGSLLGMIGGLGAVLVLGYWLYHSAAGQAALHGPKG